MHVFCVRDARRIIDLARYSLNVVERNIWLRIFFCVRSFVAHFMHKTYQQMFVHCLKYAYEVTVIFNFIQCSQKDIFNNSLSRFSFRSEQKMHQRVRMVYKK